MIEIDALHLSLVEYLVIVIVATAGTAVQGTVGFGANLLSVPVVALFVPEALPAAMMLWAFPLTIAMTLREREGINWPIVGWMTLGRVPGVAIGAWVVSSVATSTLSVFCGVSVLVAVGVTVMMPEFALTPTNVTGAGFASGVTGTATAIGGPPMAVVLQHEEGPVLRATMAAGFLSGIVISMTALAAFGEVHWWHVLLAIALLPGQALGLVMSTHLTRRLDGRWLRPAVLVCSAGSAVTTLVRGLM